MNAGKIAAAWSAEHPGEAIPQDVIESGAHGEELRRLAKSAAKVAAGIFFDQHAVPAIKSVFAKAAEKLRDVIVERVKTEQEAFEKFASVYHDEESISYKPSPGILRLMSRRRMLLDQEILRTSPPSISVTLSGIYKITAA